MPVIAVIQQKGGVGKTTIAANLAGEFAAKRRVVVLDLDPQQSLVSWAQMGDGVLKGCVRSVDAQKPTAFQAAVDAAAREADIVLLDCPPGFPDVARLAALLADLALLPVTASALDLLAAKQAIDLMGEARKQRHGKKPKVALIPSKVAQSTTLGRDLPSNLKALGEKVLPGISQRVAVAESVLMGLTVRESDPESESAREFRALARAVEGAW